MFPGSASNMKQNGVSSNMRITVYELTVKKKKLEEFLGWKHPKKHARKEV